MIASSINTGVVINNGLRFNTLYIPPGYITLSHFDSSITTRFITPGTIMAYSSTTTPTNFLNCDGSVVSQTTYASLFAVIGSTFNTGGEGGGNFRLPDLRGRYGMGLGTGPNLTSRTIAQTNGAENVSITTASLPSHTHNVSGNSGGSSSNHSHGWTHWTNNQNNNGGGGYTQISPPGGSGVFTSGGINTNHNHSASASLDGGAVSNQAHANTQPSLVLRYYIRY